MLATIYDDTWNMLNMHHITSNSKRWDYSGIPGGGNKKTEPEGPTAMLRGHHLRKSPNPTHSQRASNAEMLPCHDVIMNVVGVMHTRLTLMVLKPEYSKWTRPITWLLMPWLLAPSAPRQPRHWPCTTNGVLVFQDFIHPRHRSLKY